MARFTNHQRRQYAHHDEDNIRRAVGNDTYDLATGPTVTSKTYAGTAPGDTRKLRGIPAIGKGVRGAIPGTTPDDIIHTKRHR